MECQGEKTVMKKLVLILSVVFVLTSCTKKNEQPVIKGKLVYRSCASVVVQVLDPEYYSIGQDNWQQTPSKAAYQNVFAVSNQCSFPGSITVDQEFSFQVINEDPKNKDCVRCALFDNPPQKSHLIRVIEGGR